MIKIDSIVEDFGEKGIKVTFHLYAITGRLHICSNNIFEMENFYRYRRKIEKDTEKAAEYENIRAFLEAAAIANAKLEKMENSSGKLIVYLTFFSEDQKENFKKDIGQLTKQTTEIW